MNETAPAIRIETPGHDAVARNVKIDIRDLNFHYGKAHALKHVDKANIPINAQIPITVAANVCGVSINILSIGAGSGSSKGCTANTTSPELTQAVQQQLAANGSVGGGAQTNTGATTTTTPTTTTQPAATTPPK